MTMPNASHLRRLYGCLALCLLSAIVIFENFSRKTFPAYFFTNVIIWMFILVLVLVLILRIGAIYRYRKILSECFQINYFWSSEEGYGQWLQLHQENISRILGEYRHKADSEDSPAQEVIASQMRYQDAKSAAKYFGFKI